jgi:hypothetical protein
MGLSITQALIALAITALAALALGGVITNYAKESTRVDRKILSSQLSSELGLRLQKLQFEELQSLCAQASAQSCRKGAGLTPELANGTAFPLDSRLDWNGVPSSTGQACLSLQGCEFKLGGTVIDLKLSLAWLDQGLDSTVRERHFTVRKSR